MPEGWTLASVSGPGGPEIQAGEIVFTGVLPQTNFSFSYDILVPADESGTRQIVGEYEYQVTGMMNPATDYAHPNPLLVEPLLYHSADYREPFWMVDGTEVSRVLSYWRAGAYHPNPTGIDGYGPGAVPAGMALPHSADYREPYWMIDATEVNRVLSYWRAGSYHANPDGADGYAAGPSPQGESEGSQDGPRILAAAATVSDLSSQAMPATAHAVSNVHFVPGGTLTVTGQIVYEGTLWSLAWFPELPPGWQVVSVSGPGNPELQHGAIVWTGELSSPIDLEYVVQIPADADGEHLIRNRIETLFSGQINPSTWQ